MSKYDFSGKATALLDVLLSFGNKTVVEGKAKSASRARSASQSRSQFIGVSKNGDKWQALITVNKRKTYIGSYSCEQHAAVAFDFYSIVLHYFTATTNFSYAKQDVIDMIANFKNNGDELRPEELHF
uniref:AP2/ERF domain-containing protein n=1 Tax=Euplotes harpa TaxID=151035 RepID=A0A7S3NFD0_9SPIT|mmetsp:Transcript_5059/g.5969  ORF Transcript_5059/g.5969 Transcript_5059/m.5969 type:complete len:127 (+) Transcript_5059:383-763(+)